MKDFYIFLDIDGVFNFYSWLKKTGQLKNNTNPFLDEYYDDSDWGICPANVKVFNRILNTLRKNNFKPIIVISSMWRYGRMQKAIDFFNKYGIDYKDEYDKLQLSLYTLGASHLSRGKEITNYLYNKKIQKNYVIIDDYTDELHIKYINPTHILKTSGLNGLGLSPEDANRFKNEILPAIIKEKYESPFEMEK